MGLGKMPGSFFDVKVLGVTVDSLLENEAKEKVYYRCSFENFKSNTCHGLCMESLIFRLLF